VGRCKPRRILNLALYGSSVNDMLLLHASSEPCGRNCMDPKAVHSTVLNGTAACSLLPLQSCLAYSSTLKMEAAGSSETSSIPRNALNHNREEQWNDDWLILLFNDAVLRTQFIHHYLRWPRMAWRKGMIRRHHPQAYYMEGLNKTVKSFNRLARYRT
jgi:hypothetical protein